MFLFVAPSEVTAVAERFGATPFDVEGVFWSHRGEGCTFDAMVEEFGLRSDAARRGWPSSCAAPTPRGSTSRPQSAGLLAASLGLSRMFRDDLPSSRPAMALYDAFYRWSRDAVGGDAQLAGGGASRRPERDMSGATIEAAGQEPGTAAVAAARLPSFAEALRVWLKIGLLSFGGPAGQIALLHREVVDERRWVSDARFLHALNFCTLLPGPEAQQLATYLGWLLHGVRGGVAGGRAVRAAGHGGDARRCRSSTPRWARCRSWPRCSSA